MYNKYQKLRLEGSNDGYNWEVIVPYQFKRGELIQEDSAECGGSGEGVMYRWVTVPGEFMCINNDKYSVLKKQVWNIDHWEDVKPIETTYGELLEKDSGYCGYGEYWADTDNWECASVEGAYTTKIEVYGDGHCMYSYSGTQGGVTGAYWLDTTGGNAIISAYSIEARKPFKEYMLNGSPISSSVITINGGQDNVLSAYFYDYRYRVQYGENSYFVVSPSQPLWVEENRTVVISARPEAPAVGGGAWAFNHWSVGYDIVDGVPTKYKTYGTNPLELEVTSDCIVDLYYDNEAAKTGYTLLYNGYYGGTTKIDVEGTPFMKQSHWFFDEDWFAQNAMQTLETISSIHNDLLYIGSSCFAGTASNFAKNLEKVSFPTVIGVYPYAFRSLNHLYEVNIMDCETISNNAFEGCSALLSISLPKLKTLGAQAFSNCKSLSMVALLGSQVCSLGGTNQFYGCINLKSIIVPESLYQEYCNAWSVYSGLIKSY